VSSDYQRIEKAIQYIDEHAIRQPSLGDVAEHIGLSPYHFQRMFKRWTGVSPKRYLQFLTVENAKHLLARSAPVLETSDVVGLSGPGRLHDLFVSVEAVTPGQFKSGGAGMELKYGFHQTPFGNALIAMTENGLTDLWFVEEENAAEALLELQKRWPAADIKEGTEVTKKKMDLVFGGTLNQGKSHPFRFLLRGTNFQVKVWQALLQIPEGTVVSYTDVANMISRPDAVRAVAGAVAANPIAYLIPCHRVLRSSGELGGYRWGTARKKIMLTRELGGGEL